MCTKKRLKSSIDCLPQELLWEVFKGIPVKSLLMNLSFVCKRWNSVIRNPNFARFHAQQFRSNVKYLMSYEHGDKPCMKVLSGTYLEVIKNFSMDEVINSEISTKPIVGHVDGVLLIHISLPTVNNGVNTILLWNPAIGKIINVPPCRSFYKSRDVNFGFGFDSISGSYKVVAVNLKYYESKTKVYNLGSRSWVPPKENKCSINNVLYLQKYSRTLNFEGEIYWLGSLEEKAKKLTHYICFDLSSEAFTCLELPDTGDLQLRKRRLCNLRDALVLVDYSKSGQLRVWSRSSKNTTKSSTDNYYSWVVLYNLDFRNSRVKTFLFMDDMNGDIFLRCSQWPKKIFAYDLKTQRVKGFDTLGKGVVTRFDAFMDNYKPSFALLGQSSCNNKSVVLL